MRNPINKQDSQILAMDHVRFRQELNQALQDWNAAQEKLKKMIMLPDFLLSFYSREIPNYFRSVFLRAFVYYLPMGGVILTRGSRFILSKNLFML